MMRLNALRVRFCQRQTYRQRRKHRRLADAARLLFQPRSELRVHRHGYILARLAGRDGDCSFRNVDAFHRNSVTSRKRKPV
jgi:hypothetical protein